MLDEFALIRHLQDVYWSGEGQLSVEAVSLHAEHRAAEFDKRWAPLQTDWENFVGGKPSLANPAPASPAPASPAPANPAPAKPAKEI